MQTVSGNSVIQLQDLDQFSVLKLYAAFGSPLSLTFSRQLVPHLEAFSKKLDTVVLRNNRLQVQAGIPLFPPSTPSLG